ncbi:uncharacterized protein [Diadema antillarum]|uniref:uncharacterized protein n=1 Tax=Diadema antillarum TaxID=105358 RepID=UPI003A8C7303
MEALEGKNGSYQDTITQQWKDIAQRPRVPTPSRKPSEHNDMQTGVFLQLFTNSINRALHKQHCTCKGKSYDADELFTKSNPGMFGPTANQDNKSVKRIMKKKETTRSDLHECVDIKLPPLSNLRSMIPVSGSNEFIKQATQTLKEQLKEAVDDGSGTQTSPRAKPLGTTGIVEPDEELRLPSIMEIRDRNGNNWKIVQEPSMKTRQRQRTEKARYDGKLFQQISTQKIELKNTPPNTARLTLPTADTVSAIDATVIDAVSRTNTPQVQQLNFALSDLDDLLDANSTTHDDKANLPELQPLCQPALKHVCTSQLQTPKDVPDEMTRKVLLGKWAASVRTGKMSYSEYLQKVSLMSMLQRSDTMTSKKDMLHSQSQVWVSSNKEKRPRTRSLEDMLTADTKQKRLVVEANSDGLSPRPTGPSGRTDPTGGVTPANSVTVCSPDLPPELQRLYTRAAKKVATVDISQHLREQLPSNFLDLDRHKLRMQYPMYNFKREQERSNVFNRLGSQSMPGGVSVNQELERPMTNEPKEIQLQANITHVVNDRRRSKARRTLSSRQGRNAMTVTGGRIMQAPVEQKAKDEIDEMAELQRQYREQQAMIENASPSKIYTVPHQPPTTPVDAALTLASASLPEMVVHMSVEPAKEKQSNTKGPRGTVTAATEITGNDPGAEVRKNETRTAAKKADVGEPVPILTIMPEGQNCDSTLKSTSFVTVKGNKATVDKPGVRGGQEIDLERKGQYDIDAQMETQSVASEIIEHDGNFTNIDNDISKPLIGTFQKEKGDFSDAKPSITQLELANSDLATKQAPTTTFRSRSLEILARIPDGAGKTSDAQTRKPRLLGSTKPGLLTTKRVPLNTQKVEFISPAVHQGKA